MNKPRPTWDEYFSNFAELASTRSPYKTKVGCVIVSPDNRIISTGYNGFFAGAVHTHIHQDGHEVSTVHAEANAISYAARCGTSTKDCSIYITHFPCLNCFKLIVSAGIKKIYYINEYKINTIIYELKDSYVEIIKL